VEYHLYLADGTTNKKRSAGILAYEAIGYSVDSSTDFSILNYSCGTALDLHQMLNSVSGIEFTSFPVFVVHRPADFRIQSRLKRSSPWQILPEAHKNSDGCSPSELT
jgi:hypothetical protein